MEYTRVIALFCLSRMLDVVEDSTVHRPRRRNPLDGWKGVEMRTDPITLSPHPFRPSQVRALWLDPRPT